MALLVLLVTFSSFEGGLWQRAALVALQLRQLRLTLAQPSRAAPSFHSFFELLIGLFIACL